MHAAAVINMAASTPVDVLSLVSGHPAIIGMAAAMAVNMAVAAFVDMAAANRLIVAAVAGVHMAAPSVVDVAAATGTNAAATAAMWLQRL